MRWCTRESPSTQQTARKLVSNRHASNMPPPKFADLSKSVTDLFNDDFGNIYVLRLL
jgi:hypothetical protein